MPDLTNVWAVCGVDRIGVNSMLQTGFYARSANGRYTLKLTGVQPRPLPDRLSVRHLVADRGTAETT